MQMSLQINKDSLVKTATISTMQRLIAPNQTFQSVTITPLNLQCATDLQQTLKMHLSLTGQLSRVKREDKACSRQNWKRSTTPIPWPSRRNFHQEETSLWPLASLVEKTMSIVWSQVTQLHRWRKRQIWSWSGRKQIRLMESEKWTCNSRKKDVPCKHLMSTNRLLASTTKSVTPSVKWLKSSRLETLKFLPRMHLILTVFTKI